MKKKTTEISVNTSSGAEKVERIEREVSGANEEKKVKKTVKSTEKKSAQGASALGGEKLEKEMKKVNASTSDGKAERESQAAKARVEAALKRKKTQEERKAARKARAEKRAAERKKRMAEKKAAIEKRAAEKKARAEKHAAERKALAEKRKAEKEEKLRQRAHAKANKNNDNYKKKKQKAKQKTERKQKRDEREKGYGGWIAAVVSLGVVSLALATTVTVGAIEMNKNQTAMMGSYRSTMYELTGILENVDNDLDRVRVSNSPAQQSRILTDLLVQARLAELDLEKLPLEAEKDRNVTVFINTTASECERILSKLRHGEPLTEKDYEILEGLYEKNHAVRAELNKMTSCMTDKDLGCFIKKGKGTIKDAFDRIEKSTIEENKLQEIGNAEKTAGAGTQSSEKPHIEAATAEELCVRYFTGYNVADFQCIGETVARGYEAYNIQGYDDRGNQLFAEISQADGTLLRFDYYEDCTGEAFDIRGAALIAEEFLERLGYEDMEVVRLRANGSTSDFTFVYEDDDVAFYPDEIRVKVCRTRGVVSGFDATKYLRNHKGRDGDEVSVKLTQAQAQSKLRKGLDVENARLAVVDTPKGERTVYEFVCRYGEERYYVFLDAVSGEEIAIVNTKRVS